jgi:hypothetical protein
MEGRKRKGKEGEEEAASPPSGQGDNSLLFLKTSSP